MTSDTLRFDFGKNWQDFVARHFDEDRLSIARAHLLSFLDADSLDGVRFLDIGCGSGLHSLAAYGSAAQEVVSFDADSGSVAATRQLRSLVGEPDTWRVTQGSVLDAEFMAGLGTFDVVYAWGVLHHTGDQWTALRHAAARVRPGGLLYVALYTADAFTGKRDAAYWLDVKRRYNAGGWLIRRALEVGYAAAQLFGLLRQGRNPIAYVLGYRRSRGMSYWTDVRDWVGGWPMEFSWIDEVKAFARDELGFDLVRMTAGEANTEYLFRRPAEAANPETDQPGGSTSPDPGGHPAADPPRGPAAFLADCRARWAEMGLELDEQQRFDLAEQLAALVHPGYRFSEFGRLWLEDEDFHRFFARHVGTDNYHSYDRKYLLQEILKLTDEVPGDTAECGVYEGAGSYLICRYGAAGNRSHHVFDSFEGLSAPGPRDGTYWSAGAMAVPESAVRDRLAEFGDRVRFWPGWIPERFAEVAERRFSFVHVDVDLYQPTADSVAFFYPRMSPGGILLFDDYGFKTCPGARAAVDELFADKPEPIVDLPTGQALVRVGRRE